MLSPDEINRRDILLNRFRNEHISKEDAVELRRLLEREKNEAVQVGDVLLVIGISLLLALVIEYISKQRFHLSDLFKLGSKGKKGQHRRKITTFFF